MERPNSLSDKPVPAVGLLAACFFVACLSGLSSANAAGTIQAACTHENQMTTCVCSDNSIDHKEARGSTDTPTLSESSNGITIECPGPPSKYEFVPENVSDVCVATTQTNETLQSCKSVEGTSIENFLIQPTQGNVPAWTTPTTPTSNHGHSLVLPQEAFPLIDKSFFAGCLKKETNNDECVVKVSVKARTSSVNDGVLTCAYGKESNSSVPEVTLNSENNSLTIQCGSEGHMEPTQQSLTAYHCAGSNTTDCKKVNLTEIMPTFTSSWWTTDEQSSRAPKLVIPEDGFPAQEEAIVLGCNQNNNVASRDEEVDGTTAATLPTCRVKVTLSAQTSGSQAPKVSFLGLFVLASIPSVMGAC
ncbi:srs domain-containing protein [Neospora caninum Liverpool]|uniref:Srs domain-containing protein n=1 Tax=Neospora caninum (strain Liverpool) TaxID=572307 RepID=F0VAR3_NEOCL|nr:srs domain-containing protein [Neospora caninum Liverpool]CBZ51321.1 srs domain-containing protein [Neospora caninum Liverpool]CEL68636.1 TPA: SRS domain-containing protein [Neospora caninum Liverpool]|eukprot:XP_003881354.1 srs domain-containing protein [Neospora caninum Liverpool]